jgi:hypothetical protein
MREKTNRRSWRQALTMEGAIGLIWGLQSPRRSWDRPELSEAPHHLDRTNSMPTTYSTMAFASSRGHRRTTLPRGTLVVCSRRLRCMNAPSTPREDEQAAFARIWPTSIRVFDRLVSRRRSPTERASRRLPRTARSLRPSDPLSPPPDVPIRAATTVRLSLAAFQALQPSPSSPEQGSTVRRKSRSTAGMGQGGTASFDISASPGQKVVDSRGLRTKRERETSTGPW